MRIQKDLCKNWDLVLENDADAFREAYTGGPVQRVHLPHTWNATDTFVPSRGYYRGVGWYRKRFRVPEEMRGKRIVLHFEGFFQTARFFLNEQEVGFSLDGYTGEYLDITSLVRFDEENLLAVRVDNCHDPEILPGKDIPDYILYGGIYREVFLLATNPVHFVENSLFFRTPEVSAEQASAVVDVTLAAPAGARAEGEIAVYLFDPDGYQVSETVKTVQVRKTETYTLPLPPVRQPRLWDVTSPALYTLKVVYRESGEIRDAISARVGFRWFEFTVDDGFYLNGRRVQLQGVNRHQDFGGLGNAIPAEMQRLDAELLREIGGNFVRLSHYPQHPAFLDACDEKGILMFAEIASWQHVGGEKFVENALAMMKAMLLRDRNHPGIILWGLLNEGRNKTLFERLNREVKKWDPTRPTVYAENHPEEGDALGTTAIPDVLGLNYKIPHIDEIRARWRDKKMLSSEHTNADMCLRGSLHHEREYVRKLHADTQAVKERPLLAGHALWCLHDYATDYRPTWPHHKSGAFDLFRLEKEAVHVLRAHWLKKPVLHIVGPYTGFEPGQPVSLLVVSNAGRVQLTVNGKDLGEQPNSGVTEWTFPFEPGTVTATGVFGNERVHTRLETTGPPASLFITASRARFTANGRDIVLVDLEVRDTGQRLVWCELPSVLHVHGPARVAGLGGQPLVWLRAGRGRVALRALTTPGDVLVRAAAPGLPDATLMPRAEVG